MRRNCPSQALFSPAAVRRLAVLAVALAFAGWGLEWIWWQVLRENDCIVSIQLRYDDIEYEWPLVSKAILYERLEFVCFMVRGHPGHRFKSFLLTVAKAPCSFSPAKSPVKCPPSAYFRVVWQSPAACKLLKVQFIGAMAWKRSSVRSRPGPPFNPNIYQPARA
jgi:hypothetical protein